MGTRIHKQLGWIVNVDPKTIDTNKLYSILNNQKITLKDFNTYLQQKYKNFDPKTSLTLNPVNELKIELANQKELSLNSSVGELIKVIDDSNEKPKIISFSSVLVHKDWKHYDDMIDYLEAGGVPRLKVNYILGRDIFPYYQPFVVSKNLKQLPKLLKDSLCIFGNKRDDFKKSFLDEVQSYGIDIKKDFKKQIHMVAPEIIKELFNFIMSHHQVSKKELDPKMMKPAIVTYWG